MMRSLTTALIAVSALASTAAAGTVSHSFSGTFSVGIFGGFGTMVDGTPFSGSFRYQHPQVGTPAGSAMAYRFDDFELEILGNTYSFTDTIANGGIRVYDKPGFPTDYFSLIIPTTGVSIAGIELRSIDFVLQQVAGTALAGTDLPSSVNAAAFDHMPGPSNPSFLQLLGSPVGTTDFALVRGDFDVASAVPEPATLAAAVFGVVAGARAVRRRRR
ncbi:MAG: hypothetical protein SFX72_18090 [Isosphaeraceae bacterium]|nr:hypothetical protein [Isosphaeraceae bacterium]